MIVELSLEIPLAENIIRLADCITGSHDDMHSWFAQSGSRPRLERKPATAPERRFSRGRIYTARRAAELLHMIMEARP